MHAIEINHLGKTYRGKKWRKVEALKDLSLEIGRGEVFGFLGPNGAGKSTTIKSLVGLIRPTTGGGRILGTDIGSPRARQKVGYLPENPAFYDFLNAEEYLSLVGRTYRMKSADIRREAERVLHRLELWDPRRRPIRSYSKGMVQRLGLAQVLFHNPEVFILDEPMSGLDPVGRALVKEIILELREQGKAVFFSTHITSDVETICDRVGIIQQGELRSVESVDRIRTRGITGYLLRVREPSQGGEEEIRVEKEDLPRLVAQITESGRQITLIEPMRKTLEDFFLDIISDRPNPPTL